MKMSAFDRRRVVLPYGLWTCANGREVLFNRRYEPIWQRYDNVVSAADPAEWVTSVVEQRWLYNDGDTMRHAALCRRLEDVLAAFQRGEDITPMLRWPMRRVA